MFDSSPKGGGGPVPYTDQFKLRLWGYQEGKCPLCGYAIPPREVLETDLVNIDHIMPRALGGSGRQENLQLTHVLCNVGKGHAYEGGGSHRIPGHPPWPKPRREMPSGRSPQQTAWRMQKYRCFDCEGPIPPSHVLDSTLNELARRKGKKKLVHISCDPEEGS
jgi:hypothetical protein